MPTQSHAYLIVRRCVYHRTYQSEISHPAITQRHSDLNSYARAAGHSSFGELVKTSESERPTPARVARIDGLIKAGQLDRDGSIQAIIRSGAVPDAVWDAITNVCMTPTRGGVVAKRSAGSTTVMKQIESWEMSLESADGIRPIELDPEELPSPGALPTDRIVSVLDDLAQKGWSVAHVSEDRSINDDASLSFVTSQRYLLTRTAPNQSASTE